MNNKTTTESATKIGEQQTGSYLQPFLYRAPGKNNGAITKNLKQFVPWFKEHGARVEYNQLDKCETQSVIRSARENGMDVLDNIAKILSTTEDDEGEFWMEAQYFRDYRHCEEVYSKMMQDKSIEPLGNEFFGLITQGKRLITGGGFSPLRE
jgi:uncharacterized protein YbaA (DUF1428 family)